MDVVELLKKDHEKVSTLFKEFKGGDVLTRIVKRVTGDTSRRGKRSIAAKICRELDIHTRVEEEIFYPAVRATGDEELSKQIDEAEREHGSIKDDVRAVQRTDLEDDALGAKMDGMQECVDHHVREEEGEMFPRVQEVMSDEQRADLGKRIQARKRALNGGTARRATTRGGTRTATATRSRAARGKTTTARARSKPRKKTAVKQGARKRRKR